MLKVGFAAATIAIGGADAQMLSLIRHGSRFLRFTGIACEDGPGRRLTTSQVHRTLLWVGRDIPLHLSLDGGKLSHDENLHWHASYTAALPELIAESDVIVGWCLRSNAQVAALCREHETMYVEWIQNTDRGSGVLANNVRNLADWYVGCTRATLSLVPENRRANWTYIPNTVDPLRVLPRLSPQEVRSVLELPDNARVVLYCGRLVEEKQPQKVVEAINLLPDGWYGVIVGHLGSPIRKELMRLARARAPERFRWIDWLHHPGDIYSIADVFVLPSDFEGLPVAVLEAMFCGIHCVVSDLPYLRDLAKDPSEVAAIVPVRPTPEQLADAILDIDPKRCQRARQIVVNHFTVVKAMRAWETFLVTAHARWLGYKESHIEWYPTENDTPLDIWTPDPTITVADGEPPLAATAVPTTGKDQRDK